MTERVAREAVLAYLEETARQIDDEACRRIDRVPEGRWADCYVDAVERCAASLIEQLEAAQAVVQAHGPLCVEVAG